MAYFGGDPEFFLKKDGKFIPAHLAGVPEKDKALDFGYGKVFRDGFAVELVLPPETCRAMFTNGAARTVQGLLAHLNRQTTREVQEGKVGKGYTLEPAPLAGWSTEEFVSIMKEAPKDLKVFGCKPSHNAYLDGHTYRIPVDPMEWPFRTAGGHIHMDLSRPTYYGTYTHPLLKKDEKFLHAPEEKGKIASRRLMIPLVKLCDLLMGLPSVFLFPHLAEMQRMRREVYGRAGEFRAQYYEKNTPYFNDRGQREDKIETTVGLEYRTLGPEVYSNPLTLGFFLGMAKAISGYWEQNEFELLLPVLEQNGHLIEDAINRADAKLSWELYKKFAPNAVKLSYDYDTATAICASKALLLGLKSRPRLLEEFGKFELPTLARDAHDGWGNWFRGEEALSKKVPKAKDYEGEEDEYRDDEEEEEVAG